MVEKDSKVIFKSSDGIVVVPVKEGSQGSCSIIFRPQNLTIRPQDANPVPGTVESKELLGGVVRYRVAVGGHFILVDAPHQWEEMAMPEGTLYGLRRSSIVKIFSKLMCISSFFLLFLSFYAALCFGGQLIEPTRTFQEARKIQGRLTVFSEPPQLDVLLDGLKVGKTPIWLKDVKPGFHPLQIKDSDREIYVKEDKTLKIGFFKGSFITLQEKEKVLQKQAHVRGKKPDEVSEITETPEQERRRDLTLWERYVSGTSGHF